MLQFPDACRPGALPHSAAIWWRGPDSHFTTQFQFDTVLGRTICVVSCPADGMPAQAGRLTPARRQHPSD